MTGSFDAIIYIPFSSAAMKYSDAGVDFSEEGRSIEGISSALRYRRKGLGAPIELKGAFSGLIDFGDVYLAMATDGVGSKMIIAESMKKFDTVGIDCVAMNVNDLICVGAEPMAFVDYFAVERHDERVAKEIGIGLNKGAELSNMTIIGGETATLPDMIKGYDLAGTALGYVKKDSVITGEKIRVGDLIIGLPSSGPHSNGYTLIRKVLKEAGIAYDDDFNGRKVGEVLLEPTRIYVKDILSILKDGIEAHGMAHITGGGLRNLLRLKKGVGYVIEDPMDVQPIFRAIQEWGKIDDYEMYQTFNMGMGFAIIAPEESAHSIVKRISGSKIVGEVVKGSSVHVPSLGIEYREYM